MFLLRVGTNQLKPSKLLSKARLPTPETSAARFVFYYGKNLANEKKKKTIFFPTFSLQANRFFLLMLFPLWSVWWVNERELK